MIIFLILANGNDSRDVWKHAIARHYTAAQASPAVWVSPALSTSKQAAKTVPDWNSAHLRRSLTARATKTHKIDWLEQRKLQKYGANILAHLTSFTYTKQVD